MAEGGKTEKISRKYRILLCCTGSVASVKIPKIVELLQESQFEMDIQLIATERALHFFDATSMKVPVHLDEKEWLSWQKIGDPVLHIELRKWADLLIIAPLDANTLAKIAHGICDNLLTCVVRAWDVQRPLLFAPAMNTFMWHHPLTDEQVTKLKSFGYQEIPVVAKTLACGDSGLGAMAEVGTIAKCIEEQLSKIKT